MGGELIVQPAVRCLWCRRQLNADMPTPGGSFKAAETLLHLGYEGDDRNIPIACCRDCATKVLKPAVDDFVGTT